MTQIPEDPAAGNAPSPAVTRSPANDNRRRRGEAAVDEWENEGGHFPSLPSTGIEPTDVSPRASAASEGVALAAMRVRFASDFAGGLMGAHHNTFAHRSRVLRALAATERGEGGTPPR